MCVRVTKTSSRFFLSLGLVRFYSRSEEKKIPNRVAFYPRGGDQPFFLPFLPLLPFPFFHFSKLTDSFESISIQQGCFAPAGQRYPRASLPILPRGECLLTLHQKSRHSPSKIAINYRRLFFFLKKYFSLFSFESLNRSPKSNSPLFEKRTFFS